jgi:type VII secretion integral membrane protein EccD
VTAAVGPDLARVTVATPRRRVDVALPGSAIVADLLPQLLALAGDGLADDGEAHGGWTLRRSTGEPLDAVRSLAAHGVRDGEVLHLVPRRTDWPEVAYDDIVEVIASGSRRTGRAWDAAATRWCGLAVTALTLLLGLLGLAATGRPTATAAALAGGVAAVLTALGVVLSRALSDAAAGGVVGACALPYAFAAGAFAVAPRTAVGAPGVLFGSAAMLVVAVIGLVGVAAGARVFVAGAGAALAGVIGAALSLAGMSAAGAVAVVVTVAIGALPGYPAISIWLGRVPVPVMPGRPEEILQERAMPGRDDVFSAVARANELLTGAVIATALVAAVGGAVLVRSGGRVDATLALTAALALLLRARLFAAPPQRAPLLAGGAAIVGLELVAQMARASTASGRLVACAVTLVVAAVVLTASLVYSRRPPSPRTGRLADVLDVLAVLALVPLACAVAGIFEGISRVFGSVAG